MMRRLLVLLVQLLLVSAHAADIGLTPPRLHLTVPAGGTAVTTVTVLTTAAIEQQISSEASDWTLDPSGELTYLPAGTMPHSAAPWLTLEAEDFVLEAGGARELRLEVTVPANAEGTHHAMVFFTVVPPPTADPGVGVTTTTRIGLTVYVTVEGTERSGSELVDLYGPADGLLTAVVVNDGNTVMRVGGSVELRDESGEVRYVLPVPDVPILREAERGLRFELPGDLTTGFYVALALIEDDRGGLMAGEMTFEVP
jgi:hypothetical protein